MSCKYFEKPFCHLCSLCACSSADLLFVFFSKSLPLLLQLKEQQSDWVLQSQSLQPWYKFLYKLGQITGFFSLPFVSCEMAPGSSLMVLFTFSKQCVCNLG